MLFCLHLQLRKPRVENLPRDCVNSSSSVFWVQSSSSSSLISSWRKQISWTWCSTSCNTTVPVHMLSVKASPGVSKDEMKTESRRRLLKYFQKMQTSCDQNRRESVLPDQNTFRKEMNVNNSSIWRPWERLKDVCTRLSELLHFHFVILKRKCLMSSSSEEICVQLSVLMIQSMKIFLFLRKCPLTIF